MYTLLSPSFFIIAMTPSEEESCRARRHRQSHITHVGHKERCVNKRLVYEIRHERRLLTMAVVRENINLGRTRESRVLYESNPRRQAPTPHVKISSRTTRARFAKASPCHTTGTNCQSLGLGQARLRWRQGRHHQRRRPPNACLLYVVI